MSRDFYDAQDEHDIRELQRMVRSGSTPKMVGGTRPKASSRGCVVVMAFALAVPVAAVAAAAKGWG